MQIIHPAGGYRRPICAKFEQPWDLILRSNESWLFEFVSGSVIKIVGCLANRIVFCLVAEIVFELWNRNTYKFQYNSYNFLNLSWNFEEIIYNLQASYEIDIIS